MKARSNESADSLGDGSTQPDVLLGDEGGCLRAERSGLGTDRVYSATSRLRDERGNVVADDVIVRVPHDLGGSAACSRHGGDLPQVSAGDPACERTLPLLPEDPVAARESGASRVAGCAVGGRAAGGSVGALLIGLLVLGGWRWRGAALTAVVACGAVLAPGCYLSQEQDGGIDRGPPVVTEHFIAYTSERNAAWMEAQYRALGDKLDFWLTKPIVYNRELTADCAQEYCEHDEELELTCLGGDQFCMFYVARIYADALGDAPAFLRDGLAEVIAGGLAYDYAPVFHRPMRELVDYFDDARYRQARAPLDFHGLVDFHDQIGRFTRTMIDEMTLRGFLAFYRSGSRDLDRWRPETGRSLEEWVALAEARTPEFSFDRGYRLAVGECEAPEIEPGAAEVWDAGTGQPNIYARGVPTPFSSPRGSRVFSFTLPERSEVTVTVRGDENLYFAAEPCFFNPDPTLFGGLDYFAHRDQIQGTATLRPGPYFLYAGAAPWAGDRRVEVTLTVKEAP